MPESEEKTETGSVDMNQLTLLKTVDARRRKLKIRRLKYTFQTKSTPVAAASYEVDGQKFYGEAETNGGGCSREICLSLTSSARVDEHSSTKKEVVLSGFKDDVDEMIKNNKSGSFQSFGRVSYGSVSVIGRRREMEDAVRVQLGFFSSSSSSSSAEGEEEGEKYDFFGVYDGHGGARVAEACSEGLHRVLAEEMMNNYYKEGINKGEIKGMEYWGRVMEGCFERMDRQVLKDRMMGSTAVVAVVGKEELVVANCGDSRAVLCRAGVAVPLSVDHKPDRADELERVEAAGGRVINWDGQRVLGVLSTSRSIGDEYLKPFVVCKPEVTVSKRSENDEFIILATDGLWDVISNEVACHVGRRCLSGRMRRKKYPRMMSDSHAAEAAAVLAELAMARGSKDNISVIVVDLKKRSDFSSF